VSKGQPKGRYSLFFYTSKIKQKEKNKLWRVGGAFARGFL